MSTTTSAAALRTEFLAATESLATGIAEAPSLTWNATISGDYPTELVEDNARILLERLTKGFLGLGFDITEDDYSLDSTIELHLAIPSGGKLFYLESSTTLFALLGINTEDALMEGEPRKLSNTFLKNARAEYDDLLGLAASGPFEVLTSWA